LLDKLAGGLVERVARKHGLLKDRGRATRNDLSPRPILIEYAGGIFSDRSQNQRLIAVLAKLPKASLSVFHANPYFRASIVDFGDGSSYDLWVLSDTRLVISPQMRCTYASIERVSNHILSAFAEGEVKDLTEVIGVS
jgi:hypothetical protein